MKKIFLATGGLVTPNDFYGIGKWLSQKKCQPLLYTKT
jgi:hypothetical protein